MNKIVILSDSSCNLNSANKREYGVEELIPMHYIKDGVFHDADNDWTDEEAKAYYDYMRNGGDRIKSSQVNAKEYEALFKKYLDKGYDILSISCTGALSASVRESYIARDELAPNYPNQKIRCVDSACCNYALAMLIQDAAKLRDAGKDIDEIVAWVEENKLFYNEIGTVDKLTYLRLAGRISASKAFFGGIFGVKPIVVYDMEGHNVAVDKVKGRRKSFERIADMLKEYAIVNEQHNVIHIAHADALDDAKELAEIIQSRFEQKIEYIYGVIEPGVGSSVGPGTLILGLYTKKEIRMLNN